MAPRWLAVTGAEGSDNWSPALDRSSAVRFSANSGRFGTGTSWTILTVIGILLAAIFGTFVGLADFRKLELSREVRSAIRVADRAWAMAADHVALLDDVTRHRHRSDERLEAGALMREAIDSAVSSGLDRTDALDSMLYMTWPNCAWAAREGPRTTRRTRRVERLRSIAARRVPYCCQSGSQPATHG